MIFEGVITFLLFSNVRCVPVEDVPDVQINVSNKEKVLDYLIKYGYSIDVTSFSGGGQDVIKKFQEDGGLPQSGELDAATMELIATPRCGVFVENQGQAKWNKRELTYQVIRYSRKLSSNAIDRIVRRAMDFWEEAADIKFTRSGTKDVDIEIVFGRKEHGDNIPFDGPSGTLAHAYYPTRSQRPGGLSGDAHFDDDEDWSETEASGGKQLLQTCTHELGHSLGLGHSKVRGSVMYFAYPGRWQPNLRLDRDDISRIVDLYGKAPAGPTNKRTPTNRPTNTPPPTNKPTTTNRPTNKPTTTNRPTNKPTTTNRPTRGSCICSSFMRYESRTNKEVGNCETKYKGRFWCYIEPRADCRDSRTSINVDYDWSWEACKPRSSLGVPQVQDQIVDDSPFQVEQQVTDNNP